MHQVIIVSLNNNAYHFEDDAYAALRQYLRRARAGLKNNPDQNEIIGDIERSIAEKCSAVLNPGKNVVNSEEIARILREMGPVEGAGPDDEGETESQSQRTLCRKPQGAMIYGVCSGLADYFGIDAVIIRIIFLALLLFNGLGGVLYILLRIAMPAEAGTPGRRTSSGLLWAVGLLLIFSAMTFTFFPHGVDHQVFTSDFPGFGGVPWNMGIHMPMLGMAFYGVVLIILVAVGVAAVRYVMSRTSRG